MDKPRNIVIGQKISSNKLEQAKKLRRQMTKAESILWQHLRRNNLNGLHFRRQQIIEGFIVDFYCHAVGLVIEVDGKIHDRQVEYDLARERILAASGLYILRIRNEEIEENLVGVLKRIRQICSDLTPQPPSLTGKGEQD
jgi:very-short-patch-repair endonuclease